MTRGTGTAKKAPLSKERIVQAAVALADAGGFDSLSMRSLAQDLSTAPMSLYRHFANKEGLLDGMIDVVFGQMYSPAIRGAWKTELRRRGMAAREALRRHPWAVGLMETRMNPGPASAEHHNAVMGCLREGGFPFRDAVHAYNVLDAYMYGFALQEKTIPFVTAEQSAQMAEITVGERGSEYPYLAEVVHEFATSGGYDYAEEFEFGLDLVLDGLERLKRTLRSGRTSG
ncbi:MAG TPA: TetR/AcrR family transcriptional regulator [Actinomycetota bacterium]